MEASGSTKVLGLGKQNVGICKHRANHDLIHIDPRYSNESQTTVVGPDDNTVDFHMDNDLFDEASTNREELGILLRTDFSDEAAWLAFCSRLEEGEKEFIANP